MRHLSRRTFLGLAVGAVAWACARPEEEEATQTPGVDLADPDLLSLVVTVPEVAVGDRRMAVTLLDGPSPIPLGETEVRLTLRPPDTDAIEVTPRLETIQFGVGGEDMHDDHDHDHDDAHRILVFEHAFETPGFWSIEAEIAGDEPRQAEAAFEVTERSSTVMVGQPALAVPSPTQADPLDADPVCTRRPACSMHEVTVAEAVGAGKPSVLVFATPAFCTSRVCGPLVDIIDGVHQQVGDAASFVHVEVWTDSGSVGDWPEGLVGAFREWGFQNEPWTFFVDAEGIVRMRWAGTAGFDETLRATEALVAGEL